MDEKQKPCDLQGDPADPVFPPLYHCKWCGVLTTEPKQTKENCTMTVAEAPADNDST